ncbi:sugar-transfer associated ATP-grasp domain-containing protein [Reyranella sp. CPCC 100927]|uniref:sugar-transfer associated ATP-grasp domain-containing protein n=1 Tax=Reyranella sp. CPCC 100927 TaxID=2599616 RepID=UPI0011B5DA24|nr:sugar-transfer associated ATP-grasp domain-containing protein [Reyranella sp. CPCC 100927]TWT05035.1 hypothetical protein FQU96_25625 [Reyranella sp. CPCC 100927]
MKPRSLSLDQRIHPQAILALATLYALVSLLVQIGIGHSKWRVDSPTEVCVSIVVMGGLVLTAVQLYRHWPDSALRTGWLFAAIGIAFITVSVTADWFGGYALTPVDRNWAEIPPWLIAGFCFHQCTQLRASRSRVRFWGRVGLALMLVSVGLKVAESVIPLSDDLLDICQDYTSLLGLLCILSALLFSSLAADTPAAVVRRLLDVSAPVFRAAGALPAPALTPVAIGAVARALFSDLRLFRVARYPTRFDILHRPVLRQVEAVGMVILFGSRIGPRVRQAVGTPLMRQFADLLRMGVLQGIDAVSYYLFELYRPDGRARAAYYLTRRETKNGLFAALNALQPRDDTIAHDLTDKAAFGAACAAAGIATPPILLTAIDGQVSWRDDITAFDRDLFAKLMRGRGTKKTGQFHRVAPFDYVDRQGRLLSLDEIVDDMRRQSLTMVGTKTVPVILQPRLYNHPDLADLAKDSLMVIRAVTCLDRDGAPEVTHAMLRILAKIEPDWDTRPDAEYGAAIDVETGDLGWLTGDDPETCLAWYDSHPVTGAPVLGRRIEQWPALRELALRAHRVFRRRIVIGWDLALTTDGPMVVEGNSNMDVSFIQRAYREPIGRSRLGELLGYHLSRL